MKACLHHITTSYRCQSNVLYLMFYNTCTWHLHRQSHYFTASITITTFVSLTRSKEGSVNCFPLYPLDELKPSTSSILSHRLFSTNFIQIFFETAKILDNYKADDNWSFERQRSIAVNRSRVIHLVCPGGLSYPLRVTPWSLGRTATVKTGEAIDSYSYSNVTEEIIFSVKILTIVFHEVER